MKSLRLLLRRRAAGRALVAVVFALAVPLAAVSIAAALLLGSLARLRAGSRGRLVRFAAFAGVYLAVELTGVLFLALYWIGPGRLGCGPADRTAYRERHYALLGRSLERLFRAARRSFAVSVEPPPTGAVVPGGPLIVASRHAGPGDSFLLACALLTVVQRRPRFVLSEALALDPFIGTALSRTPNCFVGLEAERRHRSVERIGALARGLEPSDALVIFPEGRNFTAARRASLLARLRRRRAWSRLPVARSLEHVLPARGSGVFAAIDAAPPGTHVVFLAHTGLDRIESARDAWRSVPLTTPLEATWWSVPVGEVPAEASAREDWLQDQWSRVDGWIDRHGAAPPAPEPEPEPSPGVAPPGVESGVETDGPRPLTP